LQLIVDILLTFKLLAELTINNQSAPDLIIQESKFSLFIQQPLKMTQILVENCG